MINLRKFFGILFFILTLAVLQMKFFPVRDFLLNDVVFVALIVAALFLDVAEIILIASIVVSCMLWRPSLSLESIIFFTVPVGVALVAHFISLRKIPFAVMAAVVGVCTFYLSTNWGQLWERKAFFCEVLVFDASVALLLAIFFAFCYEGEYGGIVASRRKFSS